MSPNVAVLIPCFNEEQTIADVIAKAKQALPHARIVVCDNASTDNTAQKALQAGAEVIFEPHPGKGCAVRRLFADVNADIYLLTDGDLTYELSTAQTLIDTLWRKKLDFINVSRVHSDTKAYPAGHQFGNRLLTGFIHLFFGHQIKDMLSGYKIFSRRFVKTFPAKSTGFEIETELTVFALTSKIPLSEAEAAYYPRPEGSTSKLSTFRDGFKILRTIFTLIKEERPFLFCTTATVILAGTSILLAFPLLTTYLHTGLVPRLPTAVLATGLMIWALLFFISGLILDNIRLLAQENRRQAYLTHCPPGE